MHCWLEWLVLVGNTAWAQWVNSVPPYVRKLHFMYVGVRTSSKCRWNIYLTSSKCRWSIYRTSRKRGTLRVVHKVERSSPTVMSVSGHCMVACCRCWPNAQLLWCVPWLTMTARNIWVVNVYFTMNTKQSIPINPAMMMSYNAKWSWLATPTWSGRHPYMMTSSNGNIFRVTGPLCVEFTVHRWMPCTKASDTEH